METLNTTLSTNYTKRVNNKNTRKALALDYKVLVIEALNIANQLIKEEELINTNFKALSNKKKNDFIATYKIDNKDTLVKLVCAYKTYNITIQHEASEGLLSDALKLFLHGLISKSSFKSLDKLKEARKEASEAYSNMTKEARKEAKEATLKKLS